jgi:hypothetical protein
MGIHENHPVIGAHRLDQLRHQLPDKHAIRVPTQPGQSAIAAVQRLLRQAPAQLVDNVKSDAVVLPLQISVADD